MMTTQEKIDNAKRTAMAKVNGWANVQTRAYHKKNAAKAAGDASLAEGYFRAEVKASARRARHQEAIHKLCTMERHAAEEAAWEAKKAARKAK